MKQQTVIGVSLGTALLGFFIGYFAGGGPDAGHEGEDGHERDTHAVAEEPDDHGDSADGPEFDPEDQFGLQGAPMKGAADAPVTIIEWSDFECPFCGRVNPTIDQILSEFEGDVRIVFKQLPLPFHQQAHLAAQASLAAHEQGKFWEYHDLLFENQRALQRADLERYAEQLGLDMEQFRAALDNETYKEQVDQEMAVARSHGITGTPGFLINGVKISGAQPFDNFARTIRSELEATEALIEQGSSLGEAFAARVEENLNAEEDEPDTRRRRRPRPDPNAEMYVPVGDSPVKGADDALVTIIEFSEFQCPFCSRVLPTINQVLDEYEGDVRVVFKHNPLSFHDNAEIAARASIAAQKQGKFWEYHDILFENQRALSEENLLSYAEQLGLNMDRFRRDMNSDEAGEQIEEDQALARRLAAGGTPHFFVNGMRLRGAQPFARFKQVVDAELEEARELVEAGTPRARVYDEVMEDAIRGNAPMIGGDEEEEEDDNEPAAPEPRVEIDPGDAPSKGPADAPVTIVAWTDFECPFCGRFAENLDEALEGYEDRVRVVVKQFPLSFHQNADLAGQASLAAHAQGKYWEYHDILFENRSALSREDLERYAEQVGLNMDRFRTALDEGTYAEQVQAEMREGQQLGVRGTPTWFINGRKLSGAQPPASIRQAIDAELDN